MLCRKNKCEDCYIISDFLSLAREKLKERKKRKVKGERCQLEAISVSGENSRWSLIRSYEWNCDIRLTDGLIDWSTDHCEAFEISRQKSCSEKTKKSRNSSGFCVFAKIRIWTFPRGSRLAGNSADSFNSPRNTIQSCEQFSEYWVNMDGSNEDFAIPNINTSSSNRILHSSPENSPATDPNSMDTSVELNGLKTNSDNRSSQQFCLRWNNHQVRKDSNVLNRSLLWKRTWDSNLLRFVMENPYSGSPVPAKVYSWNLLASRYL